MIISTILPWPAAHGNQVRLAKIMTWLTGLGHEIIFVSTAARIAPAVRRRMAKMAFAVYALEDFSEEMTLADRVIFLADQFLHHLGGRLAPVLRLDRHALFKKSMCPQLIKRLIPRLAARFTPDVVIAEYIFLAPLLSFFGAKTLKLIDTHDVFSRKEREVAAHGIADASSCSEQEERALLLHADTVIAIQKDEARMLRHLVPERQVITVGTDFMVRHDAPKRPDTGATLAIIASNNQLNAHGIKHFLSRCWPIILQKHPTAELLVAGTVCDKVTHGKNHESRITTLGWVENLDEVYDQADIVINPTIAGTGLKIKSVLALCQGKPLVAFANGLEGLPLEDEEPFVRATDWEDFTESVLHLLNDPARRTSLGAAAYNYASRHFTTAMVYRELDKVLQEHGTK